MKFYYVDSGDLSPYHATMGSAKKDANALAKDSHDDIVVKVVEVTTDKTNMLRLLNTNGGHTSFGEVVHIAKARRRK